MKKWKGINRSRTFIGATVFFTTSVMLLSGFLTFLLMYALHILDIMPDLK